MFDLEQSIADWRRQMLAAGIKTPVPLEELEIHLREEIEMQMKSGLSEQEVFNAAVLQIGRTDILKTEFAKIGGTICGRFKQHICTLAGIPNYQLATNMNASNSNIEPRWATYLKAATFVFPALCLWTLSTVFILPQLNQVCQKANLSTSAFDGAPTLAKAALAISKAMILFLTPHGLIIFDIIIFTFILLEWRSTKWPRYRRVVVGTGVFLINFAILISITMMVVIALVAAPRLVQFAH